MKCFIILIFFINYNMENNVSNDEIFNLIKNQKFDELYNLIKAKKIKNFDLRDTNFNYLIQYIINYNLVHIMELILKLNETEEFNIRMDILDTDGRSILYNCIKFGYNQMMNMLIDYNKKNIGISIIDIKDILGLTALHYSIIFNNFEAFKNLLENEADPYIVSKDGSNVFITCLMYKRNNMLEYLIDKNYNVNFTNRSGDSLLQLAINYQNNEAINMLLKTNINLSNINTDFGLNAFHQTIILDNFKLYKILLEKNLDYNMADFYGNTPLHYIFIEKRIGYLDLLLAKPNIKFNISNLNGETPLHLLLGSDIDLDDISSESLNKIIMETDLNLQNNQGQTCLMKIIKNNLVDKFKDILKIKPLNFFIEDNEENKIKLTDEIIDLLTESFYNQIKLQADDLLLDWEKYCSTDTYDKLKSLIISKTGAKTSESLCKEKIKEVLIKERRSLPKVSNINFNLDSGIFMNNCFYTGSPIDILFGLIFLHQELRSKGLGIILDYPMTLNASLESYYKKIGLDYPYKLDFSNIEIIWSYQKIFYPTYFEDQVKKIMSESKYITIPIGIETSVGSHANILFWDLEKNTLERFEPNGSNFPIGLNYNPDLLDSLIENKFKQFNSDLVYYPPKKFLPPVGFQILEGLETPKCRQIGDPNGFCGVWCIWWVYQRFFNISNPKLKIDTLADELIKYIKFDNQSFKTIIRNFSKKITEIRDRYLKKQSIDINDWIVGNYSHETLDKLEKDLMNLINV